MHSILSMSAALLAATGLLAGSVRAGEAAQPLAPGYQELPFKLPEPGSYELPALGQAADGRVLDSTGRDLNLHQLYGDKLVLLSFIYSACGDVNGCPLATAVFHKLQKRLLQQPDIARQLRLVTLSFNPGHDTPEVMAQYGKSFGEGLEWRFLTTRSEADIQPILAAYGQTAQKDYDAQGHFTGTFSHILRVYLIDRDRRIRNIYTVSFLHPDTLFNDVRTLLLERPKTTTVLRPPAAGALGPGDVKAGYESGDYQTRSAALTERQGKRADLGSYIKHPPLGLPKVPVPPDNPITPAKLELGRKLFYDRRLSLNNTFSCAMCHIPEQGFASNEQAMAVGIEGRSVRRNAPTLYNTAYLQRLFHDGREDSLEQQVWGPLLARNEMGAPSVGYVVGKLKGLADYAGLFERAFNKRGPSMETLGMAIAAYERALDSADSPFDRWRYGQQAGALGSAAQRGFALFTGKAGCSACHTVGEKYALFTDQGLHNTGIGYRAAMGPAATAPIQVAPGVAVNIDPAALASVSEPRPNDLGRYEITQNPADRWQYRTPSLRNIALTAPYMHDGSLATLKAVVEFYNQGGVPNENLDPLIKPLNLDAGERADLVGFLNALTGSNVRDLVLDAFAAPVGDPR
ncbi:Cytochrome c peroxidase [Methylomagnum ishizawai]|uniref:Methylamine utilization protein MauG n=1 Tax=Methylomagnum ishizawai TaxID=1760988 RepID=A0A1Y6CW46_9GAMM|nr:Cytochrome c peroxidase [Methylomagnum ishizawai]